MKEKVNSTASRVISIIGSIAFSVFALVFAHFAFRSSELLYPCPEKAFYARLSFYFCIALVMLAALFFAARKRFFVPKLAFLILSAFLIPLFLFFSALIDFPSESYTTDINNYGRYDIPEEIPDHVPSSITSGMSPIRYSYRYSVTLDYGFEHYLEVKMTDEIYSEYSSRYSSRLVDCWYAEGYKECIFEETGFISDYDSENSYFDSTQISKIIFNDENKTVIFVTVGGVGTGIRVENSCYFERFDLDPDTYFDKVS